MENPRRKRQMLINNLRNSIRESSPIISKNRHKIDQITNFNLIPCQNYQELTERQKHDPKLLHDLSVFEQKYQLKEKLGQGSDGVVYKCLRKDDNKIFAVKTMMMDDQQLYFLSSNFKIIKKLHHRYIVKYQALYIDVCKHKCYLIMEYLPYPSLAQFIPFKQENDMKPIMHQLFEALQYLHENSICHRDIKPQNIALNFQLNQIKILDFGISNVTLKRGQKKSLLTITGTLYYRAPQMFSGGGYDEKIDLWSTGITIYKLLLGKTPFQSIYHSETISNILKNEIDWDSQKYEHLSENIKDLIKKLICEKQTRLTSKQAKQHKWFQNIFQEQQKDSQIDEQIIDQEISPVLFCDNEKKQFPQWAKSPIPSKFQNRSELSLEFLQQ